MRKKVTDVDDSIKRIPASDHPLSADVFFIQGREYTYVVDVGSNDEAFEEVASIPKRRLSLPIFMPITLTT